MKRDIVVCCEKMLHAIAVGYITPRFDEGLMAIRREGTYPEVFAFCPWCSKKTPFPFKQAK